MSYLGAVQESLESNQAVEELEAALLEAKSKAEEKALAIDTIKENFEIELGAIIENALAAMKSAVTQESTNKLVSEVLSFASKTSVYTDIDMPDDVDISLFANVGEEIAA